MENTCNDNFKPKFYYVSKTLDLSSSINLDNKYKTFRLLLSEFDLSFLQLGSKHFINGKKYKVMLIPAVQITEDNMYDVYVIFKQLKK